MNIRLARQHLRLRLDEGEFAALMAGDVQSFALRMPGLAWKVIARKGAPGHLGFNADKHGIDLAFPEDKLTLFAESLPSRDGLHFRLPVDVELALEVVLEVDVKRAR